MVIYLVRSEFSHGTASFYCIDQRGRFGRNGRQNAVVVADFGRPLPQTLADRVRYFGRYFAQSCDGRRFGRMVVQFDAPRGAELGDGGGVHCHGIVDFGAG